MPTFEHLQQLKNHIPLPADKQQIGACLTCSYWDADDVRRDESQVARVAVCLHPELVEYSLIVSGSSGCSRWAVEPAAGAEARAYAERYEEP